MVNPDKPEKLDERPRKGTDEDYRCIEAAAGIETPNHQFRHRLARCIERWAHWEPDYSEVRHAASLKAVRQLKTDAQRLLRDLTYPTYIGDDQSEQAQALAYGYAMDFLGASGVLVQHLHELVEQANETLDVMPPDKGGRPADVEFAMLIQCLANLYEEFTPRAAGVSYHGTTYQGPFFRFVNECLERLAPSLSRENVALGKALQRHLSRRKRRRRMDRT